MITQRMHKIIVVAISISFFLFLMRSSNAQNSIVGSWGIGVDGPDVLSITFYPNGSYIHWQTADPDNDTGFEGVEYGTYNYDPTTGEMVTNQARDDNGDHGISDWSSSCTGDGCATAADTFIVEGDSLTIVDGDETGTLQRVKSDSSPIVGSWGTGIDGNDVLSITLYPNGSYIHWETADPNNDTGFEGVEYGTYNYDPAAKNLIANPIRDENGDHGLSDFTNCSVDCIIVEVSGDVLTIIEDDETFTLARVKVGNEATTASFPDYFPIDPRVHGVKMFEWTVGENNGEITTSEIDGQKTIDYTSGSITGVEITNFSFLGTLVASNDGSNVNYLSILDFLLSDDSSLSGHPAGWAFGELSDGLIKEFGSYYLLRSNDLSVEEFDNSGSSTLVQIQDVTVLHGQHNEAVIFWALDEERNFQNLTEATPLTNLGITLPETSDTNGVAITEFEIYGLNTGLIAFGDIDASTGKLENLNQLKSVATVSEITVNLHNQNVQGGTFSYTPVADFFANPNIQDFTLGVDENFDGGIDDVFTIHINQDGTGTIKFSETDINGIVVTSNNGETLEFTETDGSGDQFFYKITATSSDPNTVLNVLSEVTTPAGQEDSADILIRGKFSPISSNVITVNLHNQNVQGGTFSYTPVADFFTNPNIQDFSLDTDEDFNGEIDNAISVHINQDGSGTITFSETDINNIQVTSNSGETLEFTETDESGDQFFHKITATSNDPTAALNVLVDITTPEGQEDSADILVRGKLISMSSNVNNLPKIDAISAVTILEDANQQTVPLAGITAGNGESQALTVTASSNNTSLIPNPTVDYTSPNETGSLMFTPAANVSGTATITVTVMDDGGTANGGVDTVTTIFDVTVTAVNDIPSIDGINNITISENANEQTVNLSGITAGIGETQTISITAISDNPGLIPNPNVSYTSPNEAGSLNFTPVTNTSGSATITLTVMDDGGKEHGGVDIATVIFNVTVTPVVKVLTLNSIGDQFVEELQELTFTAVATDTDPTSTSQVFSLDTAAINLGASIDANNGVFSWTSTADQGPAIYHITITVTNNGTPALSDSEEVKVTVNDPLAILLELYQGWNLISLSKQPVDNSIKIIFDDKTADFGWTWDGENQRYKVVSKITLNKGVWIYSNDNFLNENAVIINLP